MIKISITIIPFEIIVIDIYFISRNQVLTKRILIREDFVKCVCLPFKNGDVVLPLVHCIWVLCCIKIKVFNMLLGFVDCH